MPRSNYGRFVDGVQISGVNLNVHQKGKVFYVCNSSVLAPNGAPGTNIGIGKTPEKPYATIAYAVSQCVANRGDKIIVLPGHAETITAAAGIALSTAGIDVIGMGVGAQRPTITYTTANTATMTISAANVKVQNILFVGNFLAIAAAIDVSAVGAKIWDCEFRDVDATHGFVKAVRTSAVANACDGLSVKDCLFYGVGTTAATSFVNIREAMARLEVENNNVFIQGTTATTGALILATSMAITSLFCSRNNVQSLYTGSAGCLIVGATGSTGVVRDNFITITGGGTDLLCTASTGLGFCNNYIQSAADKSGTLFPAVE